MTLLENNRYITKPLKKGEKIIEGKNQYYQSNNLYSAFTDLGILDTSTCVPGWVKLTKNTYVFKIGEVHAIIMHT